MAVSETNEERLWHGSMASTRLLEKTSKRLGLFRGLVEKTGSFQVRREGWSRRVGSLVRVAGQAEELHLELEALSAGYFNSFGSQVGWLP